MKYIFLIILIASQVYSDVTIIYKCSDEFKANITRDIENFLTKYPSNYSNVILKCHKNYQLVIQRNLFPINYNILTLSISGFNIRLMPDAFRNFQAINLINITNCDINYIHENTFRDIATLNRVYLVQNNLTSILTNTFGNLDYLDLSKNQIEYLSEIIYNSLIKSIKQINLKSNPLLCDCVNKWIVDRNYSTNNTMIDPIEPCDKSKLSNCHVYHNVIINNATTLYRIPSFQSITTIKCPLTIVNATLKYQFVWISPNNYVFSSQNDIYKNLFNNVAFLITPLYIETIFNVNSTTNELIIKNFRGYFNGTWRCRVIFVGGEYVEKPIDFLSIINLKNNVFIKLIIIGFFVAFVVFLIAAIIALCQYLKETSCCMHKIDYDNSELFEKKYVNTVIPVPYEGDIIEVSSGTGSSDESKSSYEGDENREPLNNSENEDENDIESGRARHESYNNNDVELIFRDEKLAEEYVQILEELKQASEMGDDKFGDRLTVLRNRFSMDFKKMRFELKRGMETLKSNSSAAAHKLRKSVGNHMKSFSEFCGSGNLAQSISIVVIPSNNGPSTSKTTNHDNKNTMSSSLPYENNNDTIDESSQYLASSSPASRQRRPHRHHHHHRRHHHRHQTEEEKQQNEDYKKHTRKVFRFFEYPNPIHNTIPDDKE